MTRQIKAIAMLLLATNPAWAAEADQQASQEVVRLRAEVMQLRAEIQVLRAQARQFEPARVAAGSVPRPTPPPSTQLFAPLGGSGHAGRRWNALLEFYDGPSPYGQFYPQDVRYRGAAIQLGL